jgi:hypothetical protein
MRLGLASISIPGDLISIILELPDQKVPAFLVRITLSWWFSEHACKVFGAISVKT